jgi:putative nucleotidyltransferase with HDIG domain
MSPHRIEDEVEIHALSTEQLIEQMTDIPSLPMVVGQVLSIIDNDEPSVDSLAGAIEADHAFAARVLRIANSAFYGMAEDIYTVRDAIIVIGLDAVRSLAVSAAVVTGVWVDDEAFDKKRFWIHSLGTGIFAETIALRLRQPKPDAVFTLGVLHDIGRVILLQAVPDRYHTVLETARAWRCYLWQAEREVLGFDHGEIGARLTRKWRLPPEYGEAIQCHHQPSRAPRDARLAYVLSLADALSHNVETSEREATLTPPLYRSLWEPLGLSDAAVREIRSRTDFILERARAFYDTATA